MPLEMLDFEVYRFRKNRGLCEQLAELMFRRRVEHLRATTKRGPVGHVTESSEAGVGVLRLGRVSCTV
jgi:hypothetical protein